MNTAAKTENDKRDRSNEPGRGGETHVGGYRFSFNRGP
jgi:hypothetical protein